ASLPHAPINSIQLRFGPAFALHPMSSLLGAQQLWVPETHVANSVFHFRWPPGAAHGPPGLVLYPVLPGSSHATVNTPCHGHHPLLAHTSPASPASAAHTLPAPSRTAPSRSPSCRACTPRPARGGPRPPVT
ncbi:hypothetical protein Vafri_411, partial [Volvox africanus]